MISSIMVYDFFNTDTISSILARHIFKDFDRFEVEIEDSKNMGGLLGPSFFLHAAMIQ